MKNYKKKSNNLYENVIFPMLNDFTLRRVNLIVFSVIEVYNCHLLDLNYRRPSGGLTLSQRRVETHQFMRRLGLLLSQLEKSSENHVT